MLDIKIVNGSILDGTGAPAFDGAVGIKDGRIVSIGDVPQAAARTIDAQGRIVSPGFIDVHTHYDAQAFWDPTFSPSCFHGVTTILGGFCGFSIAPLTPEAGGYLMRMLARVEGMPVETLQAGVPWDWSSFGDYLDRLEGRVLLNAGFFVGHSAVRRVVMGPRANSDQASDAEIAAMQALVSQSLAEGALGFSTTVSPTHNDADGGPVPSRFAAREEIMALASVVRHHEGTTLELLPSMDFTDDTVELLVDFSLAGGRPVNWNVLTIQGAGPEDRERAYRQLRAGTVARERGAEVIALTFAASPTVRLNLVSGFVFDSLPGWAPLFRLPVPERIEQLRNPFVRELLSGAVASTRAASSNVAQWQNYRVVEVFCPENRAYLDRSIGDIAQETGKSAFNTMMDIAVADALRTSFMMDPRGEDAEGYRLRAEMWESDLTLVGASDAGAHMDMIDSFAFSTIFLQKARDYGVMSLPQVVHQLTQMPARTMGIADRGVLAPGNHADIVIFDADSVARGPVHTRYDLPGTTSEGRLYADAIGIDYVIVNGQVAVEHGKVGAVRPGTVLRSGRDTFTRAIPAMAA